MKKRIYAVLVAILVLAMSTSTVFAALSPTAETASVLAEAAQSEDGEVEVLEQDVLSDALSFVEDFMSMFTTTVDLVDTPQGAPVEADSPVAVLIAQVAQEAAAVNADVAAEEVEIVPEIKAAFEFTPNEEIKAALEENGEVEVTFDVDVKAGANVVLLHFNGEEWEVIVPSEVADGKITASFTSFSPIVVVELVADQPTIAEAAPKTGEAVAVVGVAALMFLGGAGSFFVKSKED